MKNLPWKQIVPHVIAIVIFLLITLVYFSPVLEGKRLKQSDITQWKGASKELKDFREETGEEALWTNSMFVGMPAYQISVLYKKNIANYLDKLFKAGLPAPAKNLFLYLIGFFILLRILRINVWLSIAGAIAFAFSSYFFIILEVGHVTKAVAIGYMPMVLGGILLVFRGKYLWGGIFTALFMSLEVKAYHPQITYYLLLAVLIFGIFELVSAIREKRLTGFIKSTAVVAAAFVLAIGVNFPRLWTTVDVDDYTIRSASELTFNEENQTSGLDKEYATQWSYGVGETFTLLIPNLYGGGSYGFLDEKSVTYQTLVDNNIPNARQFLKQPMPLYWGDQPGTSGPVYVGSIVIFLFVLGLFLVKGRIKWWLLTATILSIMLAWGKNFMPLTNFFLDHFPMYNKFRAVSMMLVIAELTIPLLGFIALQKVFVEKDKRRVINALKYAFYITGGLALFFVLFSGSLFSFSGPSDIQYGLPDWMLEAIRSDRHRLLRLDAIRSLIFIALAFAILFFYKNEKLKAVYVYLLIPLLILFDMWPVDKRYLNNDNFERKATLEIPYEMTKADESILRDQGLNYRVYNLLERYDVSARTSYFHKNIGGYHGAKFRRFAELMDYQISEQVNGFIQLLSNRPDNFALNVGLRNLRSLNMLNVKYIIFDFESDALINMNALGNAWFVNQHKIVRDADEEITSLNSFDPSYQVIIDQRYNEYLENYTDGIDSTGYITLVDYKPNHLTYEYKTDRDQLTVFSEVYYDKGWNVYVDGQLYPHFRVNYLLRGMVVPQGENILEFKFEPKSYFVGEKISFASSVLLVLIMTGSFIWWIRRYFISKD